MTKNRFLTLIAVVLGVSLSACSASKPNPTPVENNEGESEPLPTSGSTPAPVVTESPPPVDEVPVTNNAVAELPSEEATAPDAQMMDDAAATGMTARATRGSSADEVTPVEQTERK